MNYAPSQPETLAGQGNPENFTQQAPGNQQGQNPGYQQVPYNAQQIPGYQQNPFPQQGYQQSWQQNPFLQQGYQQNPFNTQQNQGYYQNPFLQQALAAQQNAILQQALAQQNPFNAQQNQGYYQNPFLQQALAAQQNPFNAQQIHGYQQNPFLQRGVGQQVPFNVLQALAGQQNPFLQQALQALANQQNPFNAQQIPGYQQVPYIHPAQWAYIQPAQLAAYHQLIAALQQVPGFLPGVAGQQGLGNTAWLPSWGAGRPWGDPWTNPIGSNVVPQHVLSQHAAHLQALAGLAVLGSPGNVQPVNN